MSSKKKSIGKLAVALIKQRKEKGMTQLALAKAAKVGKFSISNIEKGYSRNPSRESLERLATALSCDPDQFLRLAPRATGPAKRTPIGALIYAGRKKLNLSEEELARLLGVTKQSVHQYETHNRLSCSGERLKKIVLVLNLDQKEVDALRPKFKARKIGPKTELGKLLFESRRNLFLTRETVVEQAEIKHSKLHELEMGEDPKMEPALASKLEKILKCVIPADLYSLPDKSVAAEDSILVGQDIRLLRKEKKIKMVKFAKMTGLSVHTIRSVERAQGSFRESTLRRILAVLEK